MPDVNCSRTREKHNAPGGSDAVDSLPGLGPPAATIIGLTWSDPERKRRFRLERSQVGYGTTSPLCN
jgi:hypothetical protein